MVYHIDTFEPNQKRAYVISTTVLGVFFSTVTFGLRLLARRLVSKTLHHEDWWMLAGLITSYGIGAMSIWGYAAAGGEHEAVVRARPDGAAMIKSCLMSVWVIQRLYPPTHLFVKTSIILFYVRIFRTRNFKRVAWAVWAYTLLWSIQAQLASLLECSPPTFFYDRTIKGGHCVPNPLINISLTESVLNTLGDLIIFLMPMPMLKHLHVDNRKKQALYGIFAVGLFVNITSIIRWVALLGTAEDITSSLVTSSIWTYLEVAMAITCGNLPLLAPLFGNMFRRNRTSSGRYPRYPQAYVLSDKSHRSQSGKHNTATSVSTQRAPGYGGGGMLYPEEVLLEDSSQEHLTMQHPQPAIQRDGNPTDSDGQGILVQEEITVSYLLDPTPPASAHPDDSGIQPVHPLPPRPSFASRAWAAQP